MSIVAESKDCLNGVGERVTIVENCPQTGSLAFILLNNLRLQATALGIRTAHINQPIEVPALRGEFASWLGSPDARPDLVIRFGRAARLPMSARRPVSAILTT